MLDNRWVALGDGLSLAVRFEPQLLLFLVVLLIGWVIDKALRTGANAILERVKFDRAVEGGGVGRALAQSRYNASDLVAALVYYSDAPARCRGRRCRSGRWPCGGVVPPAGTAHEGAGSPGQRDPAPGTTRVVTRSQSRRDTGHLLHTPERPSHRPTFGGDLGAKTQWRIRGCCTP